MFLTKRQNGFYYLFITDEITGKRKMISCKTKFKPEAVKFLSGFKNNSKKLQTNSFKILYLSDLQREVMKYVSDNLRAGTVKIYKSTLILMLRLLKNKPIKLITSNEIENYKSIRLKEVSQSTVNIELSTMKAIFNIAIRLNFLEINPCKYIKKIAIPQKDRLSFNEIELKLLLNNIIDPSLKNIVLTGLYTGCRLNEIINIQWKDIDLNEKVLTIRNKENFKTKTGKQRQIPISDNYYTLLSEMLNVSAEGNIISLFSPERYLFSRNGFKFNKDTISKKFKEVLRALNFPEKFHFHCLRHTFITNLIKSGVNINYVKEIAGHSEIQTTMNYIHIVTNDLREAVNKIKV
jgi:integrase